ncbi:hypothetical protein LSH36_202g00023 [Paralvinella palmiformis]|uniref:Uncharacterized protein n=1 Tax=Paralvinella palmiformis TaxID=53620 RepID=A0AAD9N659_9ANNE|nr:hypothetical protein LSH36_202g00023 [Paralvinella palmiformis]
MKGLLISTLVLVVFAIQVFGEGNDTTTITTAAPSNGTDGTPGDTASAMVLTMWWAALTGTVILLLQ